MYFAVAQARNAREKNWINQSYSPEDLFKKFEYHRPSSSKDGPAFVAGHIIGSSRKADAIEYMSLAVYDIDGGQTYEEVFTALFERKLSAIIYTTYSHLKSKTYVKTDGYVRWALKNNLPEAHTQDNVVAYLKALDKTVIVNPVVEALTEHTQDGICIVVNHDPVHKIRVVLPLKTPFRISDNGATTAAGINMWKRFYHAIGDALGFKFDPSCSDTSRLYYFPSHQMGVERSEMGEDGWQLHVTSDDKTSEYSFLDWTTFDPAPASVVSSKPAAQILHSGESLIKDTEGYSISVPGGAVINVAEWLKRNGKMAGVPLLETLRIRAPEIFRGIERDGKQHIECPFEEMHSEAGGEGTFINYESEWPKIVCMHSHCKGQLNEDFLVRMVVNGWLDAHALDVIRRATAMVRSEVHMDLPSFLASELDTSVSLSPDDSTIVPLLSHVDREALVRSVNEMFSQRKSLPGRMVDQLGLIETPSEYEMFWKKNAAGNNMSRDIVSDLVCATLTSLPFAGLRAFYKNHADRIGLRLEDFEKTISALRAHALPIDTACNALFMKELINTELAVEKRRLAEYYNVPFSTVDTIYKSIAITHVLPAEKALADAAEIFNQRYAKLERGSEVVILDTVDSKKTGRLSYKTFRAMENLNSNLRYVVDYGQGIPKSVSVFKYWLDRVKDQTHYRDTIFDPGYKNDDPSLYNTFQGFNKIPPVAGDWGRMSDHLHKVWCRGSNELYNWLVTYMADIVQNPGDRPSSAVAIIGGQGTGKSIILEHGLVPILKPHSRVSNKRDDLSNKFNGVFAETLLYVAEESVFSGDLHAMQKIKSYISSSSLEIELKARESTSQDFFVRFFFTGNDDHLLHLEGDDRRFMVLNTSDAHKQDSAYFTEMRNWFKSGGCANLHHVLKTWDPAAVGMTFADLFDPPMTDMKQHQIRMSVDVVQRFFLDLVLNGTVTTIKNAQLEYGNFVWSLDEELLIPHNSVVAAFRDYVTVNGNKKYDKNKFDETFADVIGVSPIKVTKYAVHSSDGRRQRCLVLPPRRSVLDFNRGKFVSDIEYNSATLSSEEEAEAQPNAD